jgi:hypothetical protein
MLLMIVRIASVDATVNPSFCVMYHAAGARSLGRLPALRCLNAWQQLSAVGCRAFTCCIGPMTQLKWQVGFENN